MNVGELWTLYHRGRYGEALSAIPETPSPEELPELSALRAWIHYRRKEYPAAVEESERGAGHPMAVACRMYVVAYGGTEYWDEPLFHSLVAALGADNIDALNAFTIVARESKVQVAHEDVWTRNARFIEDAAQGRPSVQTVNLVNNTGRFFDEKARGLKDRLLAESLYRMTLALYGEDGPLHHRAALLFWHTKCLLKMGRMQEAYGTAELSFRLWLRQCALETGTEPFKQKCRAAHELLLDIQRQLVEKTVGGLSSSGSNPAAPQ